MKFGKRQIVMAALVLCLGAAVYLNWQLSDNKTPTGNTNSYSDSDDASKTLGDTRLVDSDSDIPEATAAVNAPVADASDYFSEARDNREEAREDALEILNEIIENVKVTDDEKANAIAEAEKIAKRTELEASIENIIKAKGFADSVVTITDDEITVAVPGGELTDDQIINIKDAVISSTPDETKNIRIVPVN